MSYDLGTAHGKIVLDYNGDRAVSQAENDIDRLQQKAVQGDRAIGRLGKTLGGLGRGVAITGLVVGLTNGAVQAASLAVQLAGMVPQLASIASLSAALPGLYAAAAISAGVLKAAFAGVPDALKEAFNTESAAKFNEAIEKLSPAAREFAVAVRAAAPMLREFQQGLQEAFFRSANLTEVMPRLRGILDQLREPLQGLAGDFGALARKLVDFGTERKSIDFVREATESLRTALSNAAPALQPILNGLRNVGTVGLPLMERLGAAVGTVGTQFGNWLTDISEDGRLEDWINTALDTLRVLGDIAQNVGSILNSVFDAAGDTGGGLLGAIRDITAEFAEFLNSAEGSAAIRDLFTGIIDVARELAPIFTTLAGALAGALGPALSDLATGVGPALLQVVEALAPAFAPLAQAIADVAIALAPALPPLAQLLTMLVQLASGALSTLATNLAPVIELLGGAFSAALTQLAPVIGEIAAQLPAFATAGLQLATALLPLVPAVVEFATALATALLPHLPALMTAFQQMVPPLVQIATIMGGQLASALMAIIPYLPSIIGFLVSLQITIYTVVASSLAFIGVLLRVGQALMNIPGIVGSAISAFVGAIRNGFNLAIEAAKQFPYRVGQAIGILLSILINTARNAWNGLKNIFTSSISATTNLAQTLPGRIRGALSAIPGILRNLAQTAWNALLNAFRSGVGNASSTADTLPGRIKGAIGNLGGLLVGAGRDAVMGLVNGLRGAIGAAVGAAAAVGRSVISGIKSTLRISSPSKVMISIGRFVTQGLVKGLLGTATQVRAASNRLANMVNDAFSDRLISRGQRNTVINTLNNGTKQMLVLVNRANTISAKLKVAQKNLAAIQKKYADTYNAAVQKTKDSFSLIGQGQAAGDVEDAKARFRIAVDQAKNFAADIARLQKRGLGKDLINQLLAAGPEAAGAMADSLANADDATLREFVHLQNQMNKAANALGNTAVDVMYGAGLKAAQGLVDGLAAQQKAIEAQMLKIAKSMEAAIKKALKIKSPSRLMFSLGKFTGEGLKLGIESLRRQVADAAKSLATASILPTVRMTAAQTPESITRSVFGASTQQANHAEVKSFGPYRLILDGREVASFVVDTITGNPKVVSKAASEGDRQNSWSGTGRKAMG